MSNMRLRREKSDLEEGGGADERTDVMNRNAELTELVATLKTLLDFSRRREKKLVSALQEAGVETHVDLDTDDAVLQVEPSFWRNMSDRASWLIGLLVLQSLSSCILSRNEAILQRHPNIIFFLTMLVGAGGNAGNQATVRAIRGLATGSLSRGNMRAFVLREGAMSAGLALALGLFGFIRVHMFSSMPLLEAAAITVSLTAIVLCSVVVGSLLPLAFYLLDVDPANSSTTIQVLMDISGVLITCAVAALLLDGSGTGAVPSPSVMPMAASSS